MSSLKAIWEKNPRLHPDYGGGLTFLTEKFAVIHKRYGGPLSRPEFTKALDTLFPGFLQDVHRAAQYEQRHSADLDASYRNLFLSLICTYNFWVTGRKIFTLSANLTELLERTDFDLPCSAVRMPFDCAYYHWRDPHVIVPVASGARYRLEGAYAFFDHLPSTTGGAPHRHLVVYAASATQPDGDGNSAFFTLHWPDDETRVSARSIFDTLPGACRPEYLQLARLLINTLLYLSSPGAEIEKESGGQQDVDAEISRTRNVKKIRRLKKLRTHRSAHDYIYVGRSVPSYHSVPTGRKILRRVDVRGHWRHQVHGVGRSERRYLWIRPHIRGSDLAGNIRRKYRVAPPKESR